MKKKVLLILCMAVLSLSMVSCGDSSSSEKDTKSSSTISSVNEKDEVKTSASSNVDSSKNEENESSTPFEEDSSTSDTSSTGSAVVDKMIDTIKSTKSGSMVAKIEMNASIKAAYNDKDVDQSMTNKMDITSSAIFGKGTHSKTVSVVNQGKGDVTSVEEKYRVENDSKEYSSTDNGTTWTVTTYNKSDKNATDTINNIFDNKDMFKNAKVDETDDGYTVTVDLANIPQFTQEFTASMPGTKISGNLVLVIDKDYYPVSLSMTDVQFDASEFEKSMTEESTDSSTTDNKVKIKIGFIFDIKFNNWNTVDESDVMPSNDIISKATESKTTTKEIE